MKQRIDLVADQVRNLDNVALRSLIRELSHELPIKQSTLALARREQRRRKRRIGKQ
jgi:hypothetical protein